jgi:hypothetical protein
MFHIALEHAEYGEDEQWKKTENQQRLQCSEECRKPRGIQQHQSGKNSRIE